MTAYESGFEFTQHQGAWDIRMWWPSGPVTGGPQRITIEKAEDAPARDVARGISTTVLRRLDLPAAVKAAEEAGPSLEEGAREITQMVEEAGATAKRLLELEGVSAPYLVMLSAVYVQMATIGARRPIDWLARLIERRPETVRDHLKKARRDGLLSSMAGKAGGELTEKAQAVLDSTSG
ncbi:hypothetical protein [Streptomyces spectabilis]|uniref:Uncharacterized protein n=1 Tax=Streptomyces spectabilis TaxID=68270 RepID=A0A5P2XAW0_STRST|nr:hypothetical protein [Streptomyces spectabilis]MBB5103143.1 hypothetical protein [Streptomyces spectabilis]MCI3902336.1 hypothetical protein [Streptomyces spectabilis]QEV59696.1 hypothetical protein CP982_13920 [Streptomyces spectabilis]GGV14506.1 hypothetical protein GCM10010245_25210 [Streptomyces spectabilis]